MMTLRERRHAQTRDDIVDAAFALFRDRGFAAVTMEEVARAAGVSRSTAYRRFPTKEDVVLEIPNRWLVVFDHVVAEFPDDVDVATAVETAVMAVAAHIDADLERVRLAYAILDEEPSLRGTGVAGTAWVSRLAELARRHGGYDAESAAVVAGAYMGGIDATMVHWAASGGVESVVDATRRTHARLVRLFEE